MPHPSDPERPPSAATGHGAGRPELTPRGERAAPPSPAAMLQALGLDLTRPGILPDFAPPAAAPDAAAPGDEPAAASSSAAAPLAATPGTPPAATAPAPSGTRLRELPAHERPRERLMAHGPAALRDAELVALFLGTGSRGRNAIQLAEDLLRDCGDLPGLARRDIGQLTQMKGIGNAKAIHLKAALELGRRLARHRATQVPLTSPELVCELLAPELRALPVEVVKLVLLNTRHHLIRVEEISRGSLNESLAHPREVLRPAILHNAHAVILVHNHPSGDPSPSLADRRLTRSIRDAAALFQIGLLDHLIIGHPDADGRHPGWFSFNEAGAL